MTSCGRPAPRGVHEFLVFQSVSDTVREDVWRGRVLVFRGVLFRFGHGSMQIAYLVDGAAATLRSIGRLTGGHRGSPSGGKR